MQYCREVIRPGDLVSYVKEVAVSQFVVEMLFQRTIDTPFSMYVTGEDRVGVALYVDADRNEALIMHRGVPMWSPACKWRRLV